MKKFCFIIVLSFLSFRAYGIHSLQINGSSAPTIKTTDSLDITASFNGGVIANATIYYDLNGDGQLDSGDPWTMKSKLIDGGFDDEDETVDGKYQEIGAAPLTFQGKFLFYAEDNGVSDTVLITVNPASSSHSVSGKVTDPANKPHILITTMRIIDLDKKQFEYGYGDFTDASGNYSISMPDECANQYWKVVALDIAEVVPFYSSNDVLKDSIYISGTATKNIAMCFAPTDTITELTGELRNDLGSLITEPAQIIGIGNIDKILRVRTGKTDGTGKYSISIRKAISGGYLYGVQASVAGQFYPEFMNPLYKQKAGITPSPDVITMENFKVYLTTNSISGHVYLNGEPYDKCHLDCSAKSYGGTYAKTFSDGHYDMPVSDSFLPDTAYTITIAKKGIPEDYAVYDKLGSILPNASQLVILPGATGIDFYLKPTAVEEPEKEILKPSLVIHPNPFTGKVIFELSSSELTENLVLYDITGKQVTTLKSETHNGFHRFVLSGKEKLPSGIYFYSLKVEDRVLKGKVVKLQ